MIYVDMDGVLCDWHGPVIDLINNMIRQPYFHPNWWVSGVVTANMISSLSEEFPTGKITKQDLIDKAADTRSILRKIIKKMFSDPASEDWWASLPRTDLCDTIMEGVMQSGHGWSLLTKPIAKTATDNRACAMGKARWLYNNFGRMQIIVTRDKDKYAAPNTLLIDDTWHNLLSFRKAGGATLHVDDNMTKEHMAQILAEWRIK